MRYKIRGVRRKWKRIYPQFKHKHKLIVMDANSYVEKFSFNLTAINLFTIIGLSTILLIIITSIIIAFTPLREYIPGYSNPKQEKITYENKLRIDSLTNYIRLQEMMIDNIRLVINGEDIPSADNYISSKDSVNNYDNIEINPSKKDSLFRLYVRKQEEKLRGKSKYETIKNYNFHPPVKGEIINYQENNIGIDIRIEANKAINSIDDGVVLLVINSSNENSLIAIQHKNSFVSIYKNCQNILKKHSQEVKKGEVIGFTSPIGKKYNFPYLYFELWEDSKNVNPLDYIKF